MHETHIVAPRTPDSYGVIRDKLRMSSPVHVFGAGDSDLSDEGAEASCVPPANGHHSHVSCEEVAMSVIKAQKQQSRQMSAGQSEAFSTPNAALFGFGLKDRHVHPHRGSCQTSCVPPATRGVRDSQRTLT